MTQEIDAKQLQQLLAQREFLDKDKFALCIQGHSIGKIWVIHAIAIMLENMQEIGLPYPYPYNSIQPNIAEQFIATFGNTDIQHKSVKCAEHVYFK